MWVQNRIKNRCNISQVNFSFPPQVKKTFLKVQVEHAVKITEHAMEIRNYARRHKWTNVMIFKKNDQVYSTNYR